MFNGAVKMALAAGFTVALATAGAVVLPGGQAAPLLGSRSTSKITLVAARTDGPLSPADVAAVTREAT